MTNTTRAAIRLTGTKPEIEAILSALRSLNFTWESNTHYYAQRNEENKFAYYLNNLQVHLPTPATAPAQSNELQPRPGDMVLGGRK